MDYDRIAKDLSSIAATLEALEMKTTRGNTERVLGILQKIDEMKDYISEQSVVPLDEEEGG